MRIVSGQFRGRALIAPPGSNTRPTSDRARQAVFNILEHAAWAPDLHEARVIDLFAGSGTTLEAAWLNERRFIGADMNPYSLQTVRRRLNGANVSYTAPDCAGSPLVEASVTPGIAFYDVKLEKYEVEPGVCARLFSGLDAVDNWSVGYLREGVFKCMASDFRLRQKPGIETMLQLPVLEGVPCLRVGDVLGRYFYYALDCAEGD